MMLQRPKQWSYFNVISVSFSTFNVGKKSTKSCINERNLTDALNSDENLVFSNMDGAGQSVCASQRNKRTISDDNSNLHLEVKAYSPPIEPRLSRMQQIFTPSEQFIANKVDTAGNDLLPLSHRVAPFSKKSPPRLTQEMNKARDNLFMESIIHEVKLDSALVDSQQSDEKLESLVQCSVGTSEANACSSLTSLASAGLEPETNLQICHSGKKTKKRKKKTKKYKQMHAVLDLCSILEQSTIQDSVVNETAAVCPEENHSETVEFLKRHDQKFDREVSPHIATRRNDNTMEYPQVVSNSGYSSTPSSVEARHKLVVQDTVSPITVNLNLNNLLQPNCNIESVRSVHSQEQTPREDFTDSCQQKVYKLRSPDGWTNGDVGNFHLEASMLNNWSLNESGSNVHNSWIGVVGCDRGVQVCDCKQTVWSRGGDIADRHKRSNLLASKRTPTLEDEPKANGTSPSPTGHRMCDTATQHPLHIANINIHQTLTEGERNEMCEHSWKESVPTESTASSVSTLFGLTASGDHDGIERTVGTSPVLLSLSERLKAKLGCTTGRQILSSATNGSSVNDKHK